MKPITLSDAIYKIEVNPRKVISKEYVLDLLKSIVSDDCDNCVRIPVYDMATYGRGLQDIKGGGLSER